MNMTMRPISEKNGAGLDLSMTSVDDGVDLIQMSEKLTLGRSVT